MSGKKPFEKPTLKQIRDDLNYFITNKKDRDKVTLFNLPQEKTKIVTHPKLKAISQEGEFNLSTIEYPLIFFGCCGSLGLWLSELSKIKKACAEIEGAKTRVANTEKLV